MPATHPMITRWITQLDDWDQGSAFNAFQKLEREVLRASKPGNDEGLDALAKDLGEALTATKRELRKDKELTRPRYSPWTRRLLARLMGYVPNAAAAVYLKRALDDFDAREMARSALDSNPSQAATDALCEALGKSGSEFRVGVVNSLGRRKGNSAHARLKEAASDPQLEVRMAAVTALGNFAEPGHDAVLEKATRSGLPEERASAHAARLRLADKLRAGGKSSAAKRICDSVLASDAPEPQKKAARITRSAT